ncbi:MAG: diguanylate cyclase [Paracoccaceae bacterium]
MAGKILIVDDVPTNRILLKVKLASARYNTIMASTGTEALELAQDERPDLALIDFNLPDIDGLELCRRLRADPVTSGIPLLVITADTDLARISALKSGAAEVFRKPIDDMVLLARIRSLLRSREAADELGLRDLTGREFGLAEDATPFVQPARITLVAAEREQAFRWMRALQKELRDKVCIAAADEALGEGIERSATDVFVISADLAHPSEGLRLMSELRSRHATRFAGVCIVLPPGARGNAAMALDLGASDLIDAESVEDELAHRVRVQIEQKRRTDRLRTSVADGLKMAMTDPLTGLYNRRYALPHLARIAQRAQSADRSFGVMLMDLDRFKQINDSFGHAAGDAVLVEVAERFRNNLRSVDMVARIGGEEFLVALPDTSLDAARSTAERLRRVIEEEPIRTRNGQNIRVTMSVGLAIGEGHDAGPGRVDMLIARADQALMRSKSEGRNLVTVSLSAA